MAKSKPTKTTQSMSDYLTRIRGQAANAHVDETPGELVAAVKSVQEVNPQATEKTSAKREAKQAPSKAVSKPRARRSVWTNPYPDAEPHQSTVYTCDEDDLLVKQLRLKLRYSKDWMVYKHALEELAKREGIK